MKINKRSGALITTFSVLLMVLFVGLGVFAGLEIGRKNVFLFSPIQPPKKTVQEKTDPDKELAKIYSFEPDPMTQTYKITKCFLFDSNMEIPQTYCGWPVTKLGDSVFNGKSKIKVITFSKNSYITEIGDKCFFDSKLNTISFPASLTKIGDSAFGACRNLSKVTFEEVSQLTTIGNYAFSGCYIMETINIPDGVTSIGECAFLSCRNLITMTIPSGVTSINDGTFSDCSGLTTITIPSAVTIIGPDAFHCCSGLTEITIPAGVTSIGRQAFYNCSSLQSVTTSAYSSLTGSDEGVFENCISLTKVVLSAVQINNNWAQSSFNGCTNITTLKIVPSATGSRDDSYVRRECFPNKEKLKIIEIAEGINKINARVFDGCTDLETLIVDEENTGFHSNGNCIIETSRKTLVVGCKNSVIPTDGSVTIIGQYAFHDCSGLTSIIIPDSVTSIYGSAFYGCSGLTSIIIPSAVTYIGTWAFSNCSGLETITVEEGNAKYYSNGNCLIETSRKTLVVGCKNSVIPTDGSVTIIGQYAFHDCSGLTEITIPSSVTGIRDGAFNHCTSLTITMESVTPPILGSGDLDDVVAIYVPAEALETYKSAAVWSNYADKIFAIE